MAPKRKPKLSAHSMLTRSRSRLRTFPMERLPVELRIKVYEYANIHSFLTGVHYKIHWGRAIILAGILSDIEALELVAPQFL